MLKKGTQVTKESILKEGGLRERMTRSDCMVTPTPYVPCIPCIPCVPSAPHTASTGPHYHSSVETQTREQTARFPIGSFNGATLFQAWKRPLSYPLRANIAIHPLRPLHASSHTPATPSRPDSPFPVGSQHFAIRERQAVFPRHLAARGIRLSKNPWQPPQNHRSYCFRHTT